jgi:hypothetical protein
VVCEEQGTKQVFRRIYVRNRIYVMKIEVLGLAVLASDVRFLQS